MSVLPPCPICGGVTQRYQAGSTTGEQYFTSSPSYGIAGGDYSHSLPVYRCTRCGHGATDHGVTPAAIMAWYQRHELDTVFLADESGRRRTARQVLARLEKITGRVGRLLDVGAGPGLFLSEAHRRGWQVTGIEPSASSRAYAEQHFQIAAHAGGVEKLRELPAASFDVLTMFDVIEHIPDPSAALRLAARVLVPGGLLVLTTPKFDSAVARLLGKRWYSIFPAHLHFFTARSLATTLAAAELVTIASHPHVRHLSLGYLAQRLRGWLRGTPVHSKPASSGVAAVVVPVSFGDEFEVYARKE